MIRIVAAGMLVVVSGGTVAAAAGTMSASHAVLGAPVAQGTAGVSIGDGPGHAAVLHAPPDTPVSSVSTGDVDTSNGAFTVRGSGDDAGLDVSYAALANPVDSATPIRRGERIGAMSTAPSGIVIRAVLDGHPLDTAALLRAALEHSTADVVSGWTRPVDGAVISQPFGCTALVIEPVDRSCATGHIHTGVDLAVVRGTPVRAALDGAVHVTVSATGYGLHVVLDHGDGLTTLYGHLDSVAVHDGDVVSAGDVIGAVGSSGNSTGPHLHFEVRRDGVAEDPQLDVSLP